MKTSDDNGAAAVLRYLRGCPRAVLSVLRNGANDLVRRPSRTIPALDALRSLAIFLVFSDHYYFNFSRDTQTSLAVGKFPLFYFGWAGVDLFFVLSGYLIGRAIWRELQMTSTLDVPRFLIRRGLRIWPYYFCFIAWLLFSVHAGPVGAFLPDLLFYSNYREGNVAGGWSLSTEEQFYVVVPIILLLSTRLIALSKQWVVLVIAMCALPLARAAAVATLGPHSHLGMDRFVIYTPFHTHADGLVAGLLVAWLSVAHAAYLGSRSLLQNLGLPILIASIGLVLRHFSQDLFGFTALAAVFGGCVLFVLRDRSMLTRLTGSHVFYVGSRLSYAMYLNHFVVLYYVLPKVLGALGQIGTGYFGFVVGFGCAIAASVTIAAVTFVMIESPFLQLRDRWLERAAKVSGS